MHGHAKVASTVSMELPTVFDSRIWYGSVKITKMYAEGLSEIGICGKCVVWKTLPPLAQLQSMYIWKGKL